MFRHRLGGRRGGGVRIVCTQSGPEGLVSVQSSQARDGCYRQVNGPVRVAHVWHHDVVVSVGSRDLGVVGCPRGDEGD